MNTWIKKIGSHGYKKETAATVIEQAIDPVSGHRAVIWALAATAGTAALILYMMHPTRTTINGAVASGITTVVLTADPLDPSGNIIAASDYVCFQKADGTWQYGAVSTWTATTLTVVLAAALTGALLDDAQFFNFGAVGDTGHSQYALGAAAQTVVTQDVPIIAAPHKGYPIKIINPNTTDTNHNDFITYGYVNS